MTRLSSRNDGHMFSRPCSVLSPLSFEFVIPCDGLLAFLSRPQCLFRKLPVL
jgi:hypothetical protein